MMQAECCVCLAILPVDEMTSERDPYYTGSLPRLIWVCKYSLACSLRQHMRDHRHPSRMCMFCTAGTSHMLFKGSALMPRYDGPRRTLPRPA